MTHRKITTVDRVLQKITAELRKPGADPRRIVEMAGRELATHGGYHNEQRRLLQRVERLPDRDYQILYLSKQGKKHREIAKIMGTDLDSVRHSLAKTYASLLHPNNPDGEGEPLPNDESDQRAA